MESKIKVWVSNDPNAPRLIGSPGKEFNEWLQAFREQIFREWVKDTSQSHE